MDEIVAKSVEDCAHFVQFVGGPKFCRFIGEWRWKGWTIW